MLRLTRAAEPSRDDAQEFGGHALESKTTGGTAAGAHDVPMLSQLTVQGNSGAQDTGESQSAILSDQALMTLTLPAVYPAMVNLDSDSADEQLFETLLSPAPARITVTSLSTAQPLHMSVARLRATSQSNLANVTVFAGRSRRDAPSHTLELAAYLKNNLESVQASICASSEVRRSLGDLGTAYVVSGQVDNVLVVQAHSSAGVVKAKAKAV